MFSADAATRVTQDANLWLVRAFMLLAGAMVGLCAVASTSLGVRFALTRLIRWRRTCNIH